MTRRNRAGQEALVAAILMTCLLLGCESTGPKTAVGGLGGAAAGGLLVILALAVMPVPSQNKYGRRPDQKEADPWPGP